MASRRRRSKGLVADPLWYKDAVLYELHVRAFRDSDGDGIGDFRGLTSKLDYLEQLGVTAIWLLPFYPSPLRDDGYDISSYLEVHPSYGTIKDFEQFLQEAHRRGLRVITELVLNHTSDQHAWFQRARRAKPGSRARDFYVWSDTPDRYPEARIIFKDFEPSNWSWDPLAKAYYWHRFYSHQPDLNFENPAVQREMLRAVDFWFQLGVDGLRLDAVPYLYEREGTDCENLPETHDFLKKLRRHVDAKFSNRMLLAEANQWPEYAAAYFGDGDECHMNFHFPLMPRLFMALKMEDRFPILDILRQTPEIREGSQWALFLRNHDELTLEMVTDEERDYMYRVYAYDQQARINLGIRRRLAPLLGNNRRAIELLNALLLSLPGTPVVYYGDELGMGDNIFLGDRNGVRTPMQWSADRNAGFSSASPQGLYLPAIIDPEYHFETINVEAQSANQNSLLWWMRGIIALRRRYRAFGRGTIEFLEPGNRKVLAFVRRWKEEAILVVANLSRFAQYVELDLEGYAGRRPVEVFGRVEFPRVGEGSYMLSLGPHSFYWFVLQPEELPRGTAAAPSDALVLEEPWTELVAGEERELLEARLPAWLAERRWFAGKARGEFTVQILDAVPLELRGGTAYLLLSSVAYVEGDPETYSLALAHASGGRAEELAAEAPHAIVTHVRDLDPEGGERQGVLYDAVHDADFRAALLLLVHRGRSLRGEAGSVTGSRTRGQASLWRDGLPEGSRLGGAEQSNTSIFYEERFMLKLYRRLEEGTNPDLEIGTFLNRARGFHSAPLVAGRIDYDAGRRRTTSMASVHAYVPNQGDAWELTVDRVEGFLEAAATLRRGEQPFAAPPGGVLEAAAVEPPQAVLEAIGGYVESARLLGQRTAEMHLALAADEESPDFRPERFTPFSRRALTQSLRNLIKRALGTLRQRVDQLPQALRHDARALLEQEEPLLEQARAALGRRLSSFRTRVHGDYHLGQVLTSGRDFVIIDFEGEPALTIGERRLKRSPLRDVAGMLRSFHYASMTALERFSRRVPLDSETGPPLEAWADAWRVWVGGQFLASYLARARRAPILADADDEEIATLLGVHRLEKAIYELLYELNSRPDWVRIPLAGIRQVQSELQARGTP